MSIRKRVKAIFTKPEHNLTALKPEFQQLRQALERSSKSSDPLTEIVYFFNTVSRWHDRGIGDLILAFEEVDYGQYRGVLQELRMLEKHFKNAGRSEHGWNRTKRGETVTDSKVFLGNIHGLFTHPVNYWRLGKDEMKGGWGHPGMEHLNAYDVVSEQARKFMTSHTGRMIGIIDNLETLAA